MAKARGLRSKNDAKPWKCRCGTVNHPKKRRFADVPSWECRGCKRKFKGSFKFCLGEMEVDGGSLIGDVWDQGKYPYCVAFAYGKGIEVVERVSCVNNGTDPNKVERINPFELERKFGEKFPGAASKDDMSKDQGLHKVLHMGLILKEEGIPKESSRNKYQLEDLSTIPSDDFSSIMDSLAEGVPFVATYLAGKRRSKLKYCQIYKSPPKSRFIQKKAKRRGHAVVLIGGGVEGEKKFFYCVNSWKTDFCPCKNTKGEIVMGGIGKIRASDLTKNVVKLSHPEKTDSRRRLEAQDVYDISKNNYILMMATKNQYSALLRRGKQVKSEKDDQNVQSEDEIFMKFQEDHLVHGPFCDDESEYHQNLEDRCKEYSFEEMEDSHKYNGKFHHNKVSKTDGRIHSVHGVAQPATATSGVVASFPGNQGSNQPFNLATITPVIGSEAGTRITANSSTVATDNCSGTGGNTDLGTQMSMLTVAGGGEAVPKIYTEAELQAVSATPLQLHQASACSEPASHLLSPTRMCSPLHPPGFICAMFAGSPNSASAISSRLLTPTPSPPGFGATPPTSSLPSTPAWEPRSSSVDTPEPSLRGPLFLPVVPSLLPTPPADQSPRPSPPLNSRKALTAGFTVGRSSIRIKTAHRGAPISKQNLCRRLGITGETEDVTEQAIQTLVDMFKTQVPSSAVAGSPALFRAQADAVQSALLLHGGQAALDQEVTSDV